MVAPRVTIVIATRDRWTDLQRSLPHHEVPVILVDNGSTDGTPELVRKHFPHVEVLELAKNHGAVARNFGVTRAETPYVGFADDDSWWAPGALEKAADVFDTHPRLGLIAAHMLVGEEHRPDPVCAEMAASPLEGDEDIPGPSVLGFLACGAVVRRNAFLAAGGFDDIIFFMGEEERLALDLASLGWGLSYIDTVVAHHYPSPTRDTVGRQARAARNRLLTALLRRPWPIVASAVADDLRSGAVGRAALVSAARQLPRALWHRRQVPTHVEAARCELSLPS